MAKEYPRTRRVAEQMQRELAELIRAEVKDPRVGLVTLTAVEVSPDYAHAKVYFTTLAEGEQRREVEAGLRHAGGFLRRELAHRLRIRSMPELHFVFDASVERGTRVSHLIDEAIESDRKLDPQ